MNSVLSLRNRLAGWLLVGVILTTLLAVFSAAVSSLLPGVLIWLVGGLLIPNLRRAQLWQIGILLGIGLLCLAIGEWRGSSPQFLQRAIEGNQMITAMLLAVSFLRLIAMANVDPQAPLPQGKRALLRTLFGVHLLGTVMNISSVMIAGDRLSAARPLSRVQALTLLRGFSACALWSPFFASMGITLSGVPGAHLGTLIIFGLPAALVALLVSAWQLQRLPESAVAEGYPVTFAALWLPVVLAVAVIIGHLLLPEIPVLTLVTLLALIFSVGWILCREQRAGAGRLQQHVQSALPGMAGEVLLFLAAAVLASGAAALLESFNIRLVPEHFGVLAAWTTLLILIGLAIAGMHPVTTVALAAGILAPHVENANLLALTLLFGWGLGVCLSPFSGVQLTLQARYLVRMRDLALLNLPAALPLLAVAFTALYICARFTGQSG